MPQDQALQVFYGTIPLTLVLTARYFREQSLLKDILARLGRIEGELNGVRGELNAFRLDVKDEFGRVKERLVKLESRAGIVFHT